MNKKTDWKQKYYELRSKYMNALDVSYRLGVQEGAKMAKLQQMEADAAAAREMEMNQDPNQIPGMEGENPNIPPQEPGMEGEGAPVDSSQELDSAIGELESYVKSEKGSEHLTNLLKNFHKNKSENSKEKDEETLKKREEIDNIIKNF